MRDRFVSKEETNLWQGYEGRERIERIKDALDVLVKAELITESFDKSSDTSRYRPKNDLNKPNSQ